MDVRGHFDDNGPSHDRASIEDRVEKDLTKYCQDTSAQLGSRLDTYLDKNKDEMKGMLSAANDPVELKKVGDSLKRDLMGYLRDKPASGESVGDQIDKSLAALQEVQKKIHHLAVDKNLTPEEKKTRRAIAILSTSIEKQVPTVPIPTNQ